MGKSKTSGKGRLDKFYYLAKEQGYRSRAAFKLVQLNRKYQFLENARSLLDLCAAPGGWLQVAVKYMPVASLVVGVDLVPIRAIRGVTTFTGDITTAKCRTEIKKILKGGILDVVIHDGSPNVGGAWAKEALTQAALSLDALKLACDFLRPGGTFVSKVFRSQDYNALLYAFKQLFRKVEVTKPMASRATSAEIYVICMGYLAPAKIDPRLLDSRHVFKEVIEPPKVADVLHEGKQKRHRDGYVEGITVLHKEGSASDFIASEKPVDFLGTYHVINFKGAQDAALLQNPATDEEVVALCGDLRVLGKREFKHLLKWRMQLRKLFPEMAGGEKVAKEGESEGGKKGKEEEADEDAQDEEDKEVVLLDEMQELRDIMEAKQRRKKKTLNKRREKARTRTSTGMQNDAIGDMYGDDDLFNLKAIKSAKQLQRVTDRDSDDDNAEETESSEEEREPVDSEEDDEGELDEDSHRKRYARELEEYFDRAYEEYKKSSGASSRRKARARLGTSQDSELWEEAEAPAGLEGNANLEETREKEEEDNPLLVPLMEKPDPEQTKKRAVAHWFSQDVFREFGADGLGSKENGIGKTTQVRQKVLNGNSGEAGDESSDEEVEGGDLQGGIMKRKRDDADEDEEVEDDEEENEDDVEEDEDVGKKMYNTGVGGNKDDGGDFVVVPEEVDRDSDSSDLTSGDEDYDSDSRAETIAYAQRMLRKKQREEIIDDAYNRYMFDDVGLPQWFVDSEKRYMQALKPITKEEVEAIKAQNRAIDARPVKKVAEAKARKRRVAMKKMEAVRQKATAIADQPDLNSRAKNKLMERLYKNADASKKRDRKQEVVVAKKGAHGNRGKGARGKIMVDRRMLADKRSEKNAKKKGKGGKGKGGKMDAGLKAKKAKR